MTVAIQAEKYKELQEAFPDEFNHFFDSKGELNSFGKIAAENIRLKKELEFVTPT